MIHLEAITDVCTFILREYDGVPRNAPAFYHRLDYNCSATIVWQPLIKTATIKGFLACRELDKQTIIDIWEFLHERLGVEVVEYVRASGKIVTKRRAGERKWRSIQAEKFPTSLL